MAKKRPIIPTAVAFVLLAALAARGEVRVVFERNAGDRATAAFAFKNVPAPSRNDAATPARFTIVDGARDRNGGDVDRLTDGRVPRDEDEPRANFFFNAGTDGGRLAVDLGAVIAVRQINTYSWHPTTRGPQVYILYGADGTAANFNPAPRRGTTPESCGWNRIAAVDTRPRQGEGGGQYGVSLGDSSGVLGRFRHLLFDVSPTESDDPFGNTFFSEIDVVDAATTAAPEPALPYVATALTARRTDFATSPAGTLISRAVSGKYEILMDYSEMPELKTWIETKLNPTVAEWYPRIVESLPSEGFSAPERVLIMFRRDMRGVAATGGGRISCAGEWFSRNLHGEAPGAVVHELVHVVQRYRSRGNPGWLVEGVADYIRWFQYEPPSKRPRPNPDRAKYTDSYRTTGAFLNYVVENHDNDFILKINAAMREGRYTPELWKAFTGKTVEELWELYIQTLKKPAP